MPKGPLGFPRLTDIGPKVSYHRDEPSECSVNICYKGKSKKDAFIDTVEAFLNNKQEFISGLEANGVPVENVVVGGSIVKGSFGCRDMPKIRREIRELSGVNEEINSNMESLMRANSPKELIEISRRIFGEGSISHEDIIIAACSDIDVFVVTDFDIYRRKRREIMDIEDNFISSVVEQSGTNMFPIINPAEKPEPPVISSTEGMDKIVEDYYNA